MAQLARIAVLATAWIVPACASTIYTGVSSFLAVLSPEYKLETFSSITSDGATAVSASYNGFNASADSYLYGLSTGALSIGAAADTLLLNFTGSVTAVGFNVYGTNESGTAETTSLTITLSDGTKQTVTSTGTSTFIGFTTSGGVYITSVKIDSNTSDLYPTIDNVYSGLAVVSSSTPEPTSLALVGGALLALGARRRRKRDAA